MQIFIPEQFIWGPARIGSRSSSLNHLLPRRTGNSIVFLRYVCWRYPTVWPLLWYQRCWTLLLSSGRHPSAGRLGRWLVHNLQPLQICTHTPEQQQSSKVISPTSNFLTLGWYHSFSPLNDSSRRPSFLQPRVVRARIASHPACSLQSVHPDSWNASLLSTCISVWFAQLWNMLRLCGTHVRGMTRSPWNAFNWLSHVPYYEPAAATITMPTFCLKSAGFHWSGAD